ncbi:AAA family ATPase [Candidatus Dojkabacteria bacterium]|uniref:AAA family ATPase n=1 Tax=Candidatus Dojkabacteria bacterium TaxID=2099670 RepID=A0A955RGZ8_9BACT|nr:AAA family ATPase [Candidatus Dojkabacteria bacterium]
MNQQENQVQPPVPKPSVAPATQVPVVNQDNGMRPPTNLSLADEIIILEQKVADSKMPNELKQKSLGMILRLQKMSTEGAFSREFEPISEYINWVTKIPFGRLTNDNLDLGNAQKSLDANHYGLQPVKDRILEYLAVLKLQAQKQAGQTQSAAGQSDTTEMKKLQGSSSHAPILCFVGIQGVGKTTMAKSIATALGRQFVRVSLGGLGSVVELRGRSRGEIDAEPGQIIKSLIRTDVMNPLILLDEIDKVNSQTGLRADIMAALLEILDPEQNSAFMDKYVDYPINLSNAIFITTANNLGGISAALIDRLEIIRFGSYTDQDKIMIAKNYLLPKVRKATGLTEQQLSFDDNVWPLVIRPLGFDAGVRQLERTLTDLARKVALMIVQGNSTGVQINEQNFREFIPEQIGIVS